MCRTIDDDVCYQTIKYIEVNDIHLFSNEHIAVIIFKSGLHMKYTYKLFIIIFIWMVVVVVIQSYFLWPSTFYPNTRCGNTSKNSCKQFGNGYHSWLWMGQIWCFDMKETYSKQFVGEQLNHKNCYENCPNWIEHHLPNIFTYIIVALSTATLERCNKSVRHWR